MSNPKLEAGVAVRRQVMGDEFVDRALANATDWDQPLAMLAAMKCSQELKGHVRGALRNGCSKEEIREVFLHSAVYCGAPAAIDAMRSAKEVIEAWEQDEK